MHAVYGWKGGTEVRTSEGGELIISMTRNASEGENLEMSIGYTIGEANIPRMFTLDYDEDGKLSCLTTNLHVGS